MPDSAMGKGGGVGDGGCWRESVVVSRVVVVVV